MRSAAACLTLTLVAGVLLAQGAADAGQSTWKQDGERRRTELIARNGPGTDAVLRDRLLAIGVKDQEARGLVNGQPKNKDRYERAVNLGEIDKALTSELRTIVEAHGWPTIGLVGLDASNAAMLVLTHTADHEWQRTLLPQLEELADQQKIDGAPLAMVVDKELLSEGKLQRYGTQFRHVGNEMALVGVEDPAGLDRTRARLLLPPMEVYEQQLISLYHLAVSKKIVSPTAPPE